jgi:hypothetical protein
VRAKLEAARSDRGQMLAARDEADLVSDGCQATAVVAADTAGAYDSDLHAIAQ